MSKYYTICKVLHQRKFVILLFSPKGVAFAIIFTSLILFSCLSDPEDTNLCLSLSVEDYSCTEVWLDIKTSDPVMVQRNGKEITTVNCDTILVDSGLQPATTYTYTAGDESVSAATLDTTSHDFTWETYTFGDYSSVLRDVAIVDEDNIWAVGEIYFNDSTGQPDPKRYNALTLTGNDHELLRILVRDYGTITGYFPLRAIYSISSNSIWLASYADFIKWDGEEFNSKAFFMKSVPFTGQVNKIWAEREDDIFCVGNSGAIYHYTDPDWQKVESGTETRLVDVYGVEGAVFIGGWYDFQPSVLFQYKDENLKTIINEFPGNYNPERISGPVRSVWVKRNHLFTLTDYSLYRSSINTEGEGQALWTGNLAEWAINRVRGTDVNNIFTVGYNGSVWHFNGVDWKKFDELLSPNDIFRSVSVTKDMVVIIGERNLDGFHRYGLVIIGRR